MKTKYTTSIILLLTTILTFGFITANKSKTTLLFQTPEERILGVWIMENSPSDKLEFLANGQMKCYDNNTLLYTDFYNITNSCNGETLSNNEFFLKVIDSNDGTVSCAILLNGVYEDNSTTLTLLTEGQGKVVIYHKQ